MRNKKVILAEMESLRARTVALREELAKTEMAESKKNSSRYAREKETDRLNGIWSRANIEVGDVVMVKGSRSNSPRLITLLHYAGIRTSHIYIDTRSGCFNPKYKISDHGFEKITKVWHADKFIPIKELREKSEQNL